MANSIKIIYNGHNDAKLFIDGIEQKHIVGLEFKYSTEEYPVLITEQFVVGDISERHK